MPHRIEVPRRKRLLLILLRFDKLTVPRKIEGQPINVKTLTLSQIEATSSSASKPTSG